MTETDVSRSEQESTLEERVYRLVGAYVYGKLSAKHQLEWEQVKGNPQRETAYNDARKKVARDAFLGVRSRTGADFVEYFAATLCSVPQRMPEADYLALTTALVADPDRIRTLTLLALSARG